MSISSSSNSLQGKYENGWIVPFIFLLNFVLYYINVSPLLDDSDVPWHLATGRLLLETRQIPLTDPWSFASGGQPWYLLSWIWDALLGVTLWGFGLTGVLMLTVGLTASVLAMIAALLLRLRVALPAIFLTVMLASLCIMDFITARPQLSGYIMVLVFYWLLHSTRKNPSYRRLLWLPPLILVWANMHGSFMAGFSVLGAFMVEAYVTKRTLWLKRLLVVTGLCAICALINPYGLDVALGVMKTMNGSAKQSTIEWLPFAFSASAGVSAWLVIFILASNIRGSRAGIADKILAILWLIGTFFAMRNGPIFIILSAPYLAICLDEATAGLREERKASAFMGFMQRRSGVQLWAACAAVLVIFVTTAVQLPHEDKIISEHAFVDDAIDFAQEHYPSRHYLTDFNFGGQVILRTHGTLPMFMDSRAGTVYSEDKMRAYLEFMWLKDGWEQKMAAIGVDAILVSRHLAFAQAYENGQYRDKWKLVFAGKNANVYISAL